jgi:hypothetical protein
MLHTPNIATLITIMNDDPPVSLTLHAQDDGAGRLGYRGG